MHLDAYYNYKSPNKAGYTFQSGMYSRLYWGFIHKSIKTIILYIHIVYRIVFIKIQSCEQTV